MTDDQDLIAQWEQQRADRADRDRSVTVLGETLHVKSSVPPEVLFSVGDAWATYDAAKAADPKASARPLHDALVEAIRLLVTSDSQDAWDRIRSPERDDPLSTSEFGDLYGFLIGKATETPTVAPSGSPDGRKTTSKKSGGGSRSKASTSTG